ncbi:MAG: HEPN domain-containing protein [Atribacterota bacterium]|nr:HEPN domain-containing protein [Atribacterota bacterium]
MSQASKQVIWCLNKAKKEIEECKKLNKRLKHRGLLEVQQNDEVANGHIEKAQHDLKATEYLLKGKFSDVGAGTIFYAMYHCFLAIAAKFGYESGNQTCTISLIEYLKEQGKINIDAKFIELFKYEDKPMQDGSAIDIREDSTYGIKIAANEKKIDELVFMCKQLIDSTKEIVYAKT